MLDLAVDMLLIVRKVFGARMLHSRPDLNSSTTADQRDLCKLMSARITIRKVVAHSCTEGILITRATCM